jgi:polyisoprenoid-binding protein YceI
MTPVLALVLFATPDSTAAAPKAPAATQKFRLGPRAGKMQFQAFSRLTDPLGSFHTWRGSVTVPEGDLSRAIVEVHVEVATIDTANKKRDAHLQNADFFNAPKWPLATFRSKGLKPLGKGRYTVAGTLKMMGATQAVSFPAQVSIVDGQLAVKANFELDRTRWGMDGYLSTFSVNPIKKTVRVFFNVKAK